MRRYMWPNSALPSATALITACERASQGRFTLECVENHAAHYPRTLREWGRRLEKNLPSPPPSTTELTSSATIAPSQPFAESLDPTLADPSPASLYSSLLNTHPSLRNRNEFESFKRKWQYLYAYAGAGFAKGWITCHMLVWVRGDDVPEVACA
jgi:cyclopropane-fatty-acyl-phospholipid synthase